MSELDPRTREVDRRLTMKKGRLTGRYRVRERRVDWMEKRRRDRRDSRFDTRRSPFRWKKLHPRNISVIYLAIIIVVGFAIWIPDTWLVWGTHRFYLNNEAIRAIVALGLIVPLSAGVFDLSIGGVISASAVTTSWAVTIGEWPWPAAVALGLLVGLGVGLLNGFLVVKVKIDSFIATLGVSSALGAYALWLAKGRSIINGNEGFKAISGVAAAGFKWTFVYLMILAVIVWYVFEHTAAGRYLFATGGGRESARLSGVQVDRYVVGALVTSALASAAGGVLFASNFSSVNASAGPPYLLPAFAAAFFGSTQFKNRFNVVGTLLAVFVMAAGVKGFQLVGWGNEGWLDDLFFGLALVIAVGLSTYRRKVHGGRRRWWRPTESGPDRFLGRLLGWGSPRTEASKRNAEEWWFDPEDREGYHLKPPKD
ncbi:MAG: ABC transporter permease [bacterium]|nr:ABC transporter permease [bacterium]